MSNQFTSKDSSRGFLHAVRNNEQVWLPPPRDIGARLRSLRQGRGQSQRALARAAGVTNATISNIESNSVSPSVASLRKIVRTLGVSLAEFFSGEDVDPQVVYRGEELVEIGTGPVSLRLVAAGDPARTLQVLHERYEPGADTGEEMLVHPGEEAGVVVEGRITLTVGAETYELGPGDAFQFSSGTPHRFQNLGRFAAVLVSASTPPTF